jgi:predicted Zn-dependent peptidase
MTKDFKIYNLKNGMEVIFIPMPNSLTTTVMAMVKVGSKYETKEISGLSHFLEHMAFKGTKKRPSPIDIANELDNLGAEFNAFTGQEQTVYYAKSKNDSFDKILEIISDLYINPVVPEKELEKERGVIIEELNMYEDIPMRKINDDFIKLLYGDQPAGWPIIGRKEVIKNLKREDFISYRKKHYKSGNTILAISGGCSKKNIEDKIEKYFGALETKPETKMPDVIEKQEKPQELITYKKLDQAHLILGFRSFDIYDERKYPLIVLSKILGGTMSSRLFKEIRERMGAAYYINSGAYFDSNTGTFEVNAGVTTKKIEEVIITILNEFKKFKRELINEKEIDKAKNNITGKMLLGLETSDDLASYYGNQRIKNIDPLTPKEKIKKINNVTASQIKSVANDIFINEGLNLAIIGPFKNRSFLDILNI